MTNSPHIGTASQSRLDFNIDKYVNPWIPRRSHLSKLPIWVSWWLGYRAEPGSRLEKKAKGRGLPDVYLWIWAFWGAFCGVAALESVFLLSQELKERGCGLIVASYGAAAILLYNATDAPLAQPRNAMFGQIISSALGVAVTKLFLLIPPSEPFPKLDQVAISPSALSHPSIRIPEHAWVAAAIACALSSCLMSITKTVHPPAGATALIAAIDPTIIGLGWFYIPVIIISSAVMISVACVINNLDLGALMGWRKGEDSAWGRRWPVYWWTAGDVGGGWERIGRWAEQRRQRKETPNQIVGRTEIGNADMGGEVEKVPTFSSPIQLPISIHIPHPNFHHHNPPHSPRSSPPPHPPQSPRPTHSHPHPHSNPVISITKDSLNLPILLTEQEREVLLGLQRRLRHVEGPLRPAPMPGDMSTTAGMMRRESVVTIRSGGTSSSGGAGADLGRISSNHSHSYLAGGSNDIYEDQEDERSLEGSAASSSSTIVAMGCIQR